VRFLRRVFLCFLFRIHNVPTTQEVMHARRIEGRRMHCRDCKAEAWQYRGGNIEPFGGWAKT
jgi:hypothetical protein